MTSVTSVPNSILVENQKSKKRVDYSFGSLSSNGKIDFKNDVLVVAARTSANEAKDDERLKVNAKDLIIMDREHIEETYKALLEQKQAQLILLGQAQAQKNTLSEQQESIYAQLLQSNTKIADFDKKKTESEAKIVEHKNTISDLTLEKAGLIAQYDGRIRNLNNSIASKETQKTSLKNDNTRLSNTNNNLQKSNDTLSNNILNFNNQISDLQATITEDMPEEEKAQVQARIADLQTQISNCQKEKDANANQIEQNKLKMSENNAQINNLDNNIKQLQSQLDNTKTQKEETTVRYNNLIKAEETKLADEEKNLDQINNKLAEEVYIQTGLTVENAKLVEQIEEAQLFLTSIEAMLKNTESQIALNQAELDKADKKTDKAKKEETEAVTEAEEKSLTYKQTEDKAKVKAEAEEKKEKEQHQFIG